MSTYQLIHKARCEVQGALAVYVEKKDYVELGQRLDLLENRKKVFEKQLADLKQEEVVAAELGLLNDLGKYQRRLNITNRKIELLRRQSGRQSIRKKKLIEDQRRTQKKSIEEEIDDLLKKLASPENLTEAELGKVILRIDQLESEVKGAGKSTLPGDASPRMQKATAEKNSIEDYIDILQAERRKLEPRKRPIRRVQNNLKVVDGELGSKKIVELKKFLETSIAMQFRFDITENNVAKADGNFKFPIHLGSVTLKLDSGLDKKRQTERAVGVSATFEKLLNVSKVNCQDAEATTSKIAKVYPVTGNIGMEELIDQYLEVSTKAELSKSQTTAGSSKLFVDKLIFTTALNAGADPTVVLNPTPVHSITFNSNFDTSRTDVHEVIVDIAPPKSGKKKQPPQAVAVTSVPERIGIELLREPDVLRDVIADK